MKYKPYPEYRQRHIESNLTLPLGWSEKRLKFMALVSNGRDQSEVEDEQGVYEIFGSGGPFGSARTYLYDQVSVLLGRKGTIDKPLYVDHPFWTVDTMFYTKILKGTAPRFFYYLCLSIPFDYHKDMTTLPSMTQDGLVSRPIQSA